MLYEPATEIKKYPVVLGKEKVNIKKKKQLKKIQCVFFKQQQQQKTAISISLAYSHVMSGAC